MQSICTNRRISTSIEKKLAPEKKIQIAIRRVVFIHQIENLTSPNTAVFPDLFPAIRFNVWFLFPGMRQTCVCACVACEILQNLN